MEVPYEPLIDAGLDFVGLICDVFGAKEAWKGHLDVISWVGALDDAVTYVSLGAGIVVMLTKDYSEVWENPEG